MRRGIALIALTLMTALAGDAAAQSPVPALNEAARALIGSWEFSNADRDRRCTITFRAEPTAVGQRLEFDRDCASVFPFIRDIAGWTMGENDFLRLLDARGQPVLDFSEVESGVYEAPRPGEGILFIQNAGAAAPPEVTAEQMTGDWTLRRGGRTLCTLALTPTAAGADLALRVQPPCDAVVTRFAPASWQMEGGELVLKSARGQTWRFESVEGAWRRIPETPDPVLMVRK